MAEAGAGPTRSVATKLFIVAWLAVQLALPFAMKFELAPLRYHWAPFSWGMYSNSGAEYRLTLYRLAADGRREGLVLDEEVAGDAPWRRGRLEGETAAVRRIEFLRGAEIVLRRVARRDGSRGTYVGRLDWIDPRDGLRSQEIRVQGGR